MNDRSPYAPPATTSVAQSTHRSADWQLPAAALSILTWCGFAAWVSFLGKQIGKFQDLFGFGGVGLCLVGAPIIGCLLVRRKQAVETLRIQCLLNVLGLLVFTAAVRMQATGSFNRKTWWLLAGTGMLMIGLTVIINVVQASIRKKDSPS